MSDTPLLVEREGHVETWTLNRPEERNPISDQPMIEALVSAVERVNRDRHVRAVVLTGAGSAFSAGGNVKKMRDRQEIFSGLPHQMRDGYRYGIQQIPLAFYGCDVPIVAAVNGPAVGAGCDLATLCDLRVAADTAWFAESFVKLGTIPGDGGAWLLPHVIGHARASEMALTGDRSAPSRPLPGGSSMQWSPPRTSWPSLGVCRAGGRQPTSRGAHDEEAPARGQTFTPEHDPGDVRGHAATGPPCP